MRAVGGRFFACHYTLTIGIHALAEIHLLRHALHEVLSMVPRLIEGPVGPKNILIISVSSAIAECSGVRALRYIGTIART